MKVTIQHQTYGEVLYTENLFTGKKSLSIGGVPTEKLSKREFKLKDGSEAIVSGGFLLGASLYINGETIKLIPRVKWYEIVLSILPFILTVVWGNSYKLVAIVPIVGGAIGGAIGGAFTAIGLYSIKFVKPIWLKLIIAIVILAATFGICYGVACAILSVA